MTARLVLVWILSVCAGFCANEADINASKNSSLCKEIIAEKLFSDEKYRYPKRPLLNSDRDIIEYFDENGSRRIIYHLSYGMGGFPTFYDRAIGKEENITQAYYGRLWDETPTFDKRYYVDLDESAYHESGFRGFFKKNGEIYAVLANYPDTRERFIARFNKRINNMEVVCFIKPKSVDYEITKAIDSKLCKAIRANDYEAYKPVKISAEETDKLTNDLKKERSDWFVFGNLFSIDYLNDGKAYDIVRIKYSATSSVPCGSSFYRVYDKNGEKRFKPLIDVDFINCYEAEELVKARNKTYMIVRDISMLKNNKNIENGELQKVFRIYDDQNGTRKAESICEFKPIYEYE